MNEEKLKHQELMFIIDLFGPLAFTFLVHLEMGNTTGKFYISFFTFIILSAMFSPVFPAKGNIEYIIFTSTVSETYIS